MNTAINTNTPPEKKGMEQANELKISQATELYFQIASATQQDFAAWSKIPYWTIDEATALSFGKNPKLVNWLTVQPHLEISSFAREYAALREIIMRAVTIGELEERNTPLKYAIWLKPRLTTFPDILLKEINDFSKILDKPFRQSAHTKEMNTLYLLIYAIATDKFGYTATQNNHAASTIKTCVQNLKFGFDVEHSTILDKIRKGKKYYDETRIS